jgi:hypothetical protein
MMYGYNFPGACKAAGVLKAIDYPRRNFRTIKRSRADQVSLRVRDRGCKCEEENNYRG